MGATDEYLIYEWIKDQNGQVPDATSENDDRSERRFVWERQPEFPLFGETRILECLWVKMTLMKGSIRLSHLTFTELNNHPTVMGLQVMWIPSEVAGAVAMVAGTQARTPQN